MDGEATTYVVGDATTILVYRRLTGKQRLLYLAGPMRESDKTAFLSAIARCGGQAALARLLSAALGTKISQQRIWNAAHRDQTIPAEWCLAIEQATGGAVSRHALRPDLYPQGES
jgi:DNA-binding transcriptional regulator YdaS (Cro superfamily)